MAGILCSTLATVIAASHLAIGAVPLRPAPAERQAASIRGGQGFTMIDGDVRFAGWTFSNGALYADGRDVRLTAELALERVIVDLDGHVAGRDFALEGDGVFDVPIRARHHVTRWVDAAGDAGAAAQPTVTLVDVDVGRIRGALSVGVYPGGVAISAQARLCRAPNTCVALETRDLRVAPDAIELCVELPDPTVAGTVCIKL